MEHPVQEWQDQAQSIWAHLTSSEKEKFSSIADLDEIFQACLSHLQQDEEQLIERLCCNVTVAKDPNAVQFFKEEGNKRFAEKQYATAAGLYSKAISHAKSGSEALAVCFANRSAALFYLGQYSVCLEDIQHAQDHGYPERLRNKILQRKAECFQRLRKPSSCDPKLECVETVKPKKEPQTSTERLKEMALDRNPHITNASCALHLNFDTRKGRHLLASQNIEQGEVLIWEEAFASVIIPERKQWRKEIKWDTRITACDHYCHYCLNRVIASLPCQYCSFARYCSQECMDKAWRSYHYIECSMGDLLLALGMFCHTALRAVLVAGCRLFSQSLEQTGSADATDKTKVCNSKSTYHEKYCSSYQSVVNLLPHTENHPAERKFLCGLTAAALYKKLCLIMAKDLVSSTSQTEKSLTKESGTIEDWSSVRQFLGPTVLRHMLQLYCNAQAVTALQENEDESSLSLVKSNKSIRLATAVFPVLSLLNHSCDPNTTVSFTGRFVTVRANRPIRRDEEVTHCYGPHKLRMDVAERQQLLKDQYFFVCQCKACTEELKGKKTHGFFCPLCKAQLEGEEALYCTGARCTYTASQTQLTSRLNQLGNHIQIAKVQLQDNKTDNAKMTLMSCLSEAECFLSQDHLLLGEIMDHLAQAEASDGNWKAAAGHLRKSISIVKVHYGSSSMELGHELFKLAQILFNGFEVPDAMRTIMEAQKVLSMHYGPDHNLVQELKTMEECLLQFHGYPRK
ncbi:SET and MYND domain-containing protein 4 [Xenopus tropicalis]|uniref:Protein-lysine N-methyltransferase SMYD4 n=1 Tax=Xenopus tropicalis TaxID=8364 RepID=Q0VA10_XENTR|nr:SET and MYND domain-containing protein 4 [Xenopus tropicalis]AAI21315.1 hypothetical protein MGC145614 [Xenopus tropicalis]|eukprot:NP_001072288.1 SET and MYND domain-containing protein 4 [Xenopus tropicalis]